MAYQPIASLTLQLQPAVPVMSASAACCLHVLCRDCLRNGTSRAAHRRLVCVLTQLGGMFPAWICWLAYRTTLPRLNYCQFLLQSLISLSRYLTCVCFFHLLPSTVTFPLWQVLSVAILIFSLSLFLTTPVFLPASVCLAEIDSSYIFQLLISGWQM